MVIQKSLNECLSACLERDDCTAVARKDDECVLKTGPAAAQSGCGEGELYLIECIQGKASKVEHVFTCSTKSTGIIVAHSIDISLTRVQSYIRTINIIIITSIITM